jgi:hypothetical protein
MLGGGTFFVIVLRYTVLYYIPCCHKGLSAYTTLLCALLQYFSAIRDAR